MMKRTDREHEDRKKAVAEEKKEAMGGVTEADAEGVSGNEASQNASEVERRLRECEDRLIRALADYDNLRRRTAEELASAEDRGIRRVVEELIPFADAMHNAAATGKDEGVRKLMELFSSSLKRLGIELIGESDIGTEFDPMRHEAILDESSNNAKKVVKTIVSVGAVKDGRLIRAAKVVVGGDKSEE